MDFIDTQTFFVAIFDLRETPSFRTEIEESGKQKSAFANGGYESSNYIMLIGPFFLLLIIYLTFKSLKWILVCATRNCGNNFFTRLIRRKSIFKVFAFRFLLESCLEIGICAMISVLMIDG